jgi:PAS domain S-box-containing protein
LKHSDEVIGVLVLGLESDAQPESIFKNLFENLSKNFGAEIKRKQLELELNQIFNFTPDILCVANVDGYFKKVNPAMMMLLEYNQAELLAQPFMEFVHPQDREKTLIELQNIITGNPTYYIENRYITKSGKIKWLAWTTTGASEQGVLYCSAKDITDKKELEELLNKATTLARIGGWEIDAINKTVYWSEITREIHEAEPGYHPDIETAINFYKQGQNREIIVKTIDNARKNGIPGDVELQIVTAKGNLKWVRVNVEAEFADGKCLRIYGSFQDIDDRKRAEIDGKRALEERNTILESIDDAFFAIDKNWVVTYWNNMAEKVLETPKDKVLNHNLWEVFSDSVNSDSYRKYHQAVETNQAVHFEDYYEPIEKWYEISAYPSDTGLSVYFKDVTDRKLSDMRLRELNESLQKHARELAISNAELEQFAYVASHDLQEPLRMVTSFMTQLEKKYGDVVDDKGRQYIHFAVDGAKRMRQIILDLLDFSRVGRTGDDLEEIDFNKLINEILVLYRRQIEEVQASIIFEGLPVFQTYKTPIRQVFQNLISNSLKYHKAGVAPVIHISCKENATSFQFSIKDNGIGIAPEYFDKIFIIFQRLHNKDEYSGTGMGLALAKKIIENLGGKIWVKSLEGKGSTFYFSILKSDKT